jgi:FKBP-type peptidyl-prolyl cis-trans isomerase FkpA
MKNIVLSLAFLAIVSCSKDSGSPVNFDEQLTKDIALIDDYLTRNSINAIKDSSGIRYVVNFEGKGEKPLATSNVYFNVRGTVMSNGNLIVDHKERYYDIALNDVNSVLPCFRIALPKVKKGSIVTIYSPSGYAYGGTSTADGALPPNSNIIFNVRMLDEIAQFTTDTTIVQNYVNSKGINAIKDPSGLRYRITVLGNGRKPLANSSIAFNYVGKFMDNEKIFDQSIAPATALLSQLIKGFQVGMQQLPAGSKAIFYIPSGLGYGPTGDKTYTIPSNSNLIFEVELVSVN